MTRRPPRHLAAALAAVLCSAALAACSHEDHAAGDATPATPATSASASVTTPSTPAATSAPAARPVYPLTGLPVTNRAAARRPALSVKIDNIGAALPQAGIDKADLVTEALVEGGLTRLMATFQSTDAAAVGPIRSARPVDTDLLRQLGGGYFAYSGANPREIVRVRKESTALLIAWDDDHGPFWTDPGRVAPHAVFSSTGRLYARGRQLRPHAAPPPRLFAYAAAVPDGRRVSSAHLEFSPGTTAGWRWSAGARRWLRDQNGRPDLVVGGRQVAATNVVVMQVPIAHTRYHDHAGNEVPWVVVVGKGTCWVLRDGRLVRGTWNRPSAKVGMRLVDGAGKVIPLRPGQTWLELLPSPHVPSFG